MRKAILILASLFFSQSVQGQMLFVNGQKAARTIDTIKCQSDTLWIKAQYSIKDSLIQSSTVQGKKYSNIYRPWHKFLGIRLIPKARVRSEGICIIKEVRIVPGPEYDSLFYMSSSFQADSIKVNNKIVWSKPKRKPNDPIRFGCGIPTFELKTTPLREERKKKKEKERKK